MGIVYGYACLSVRAQNRERQMDGLKEMPVDDFDKRTLMW